MEIPRRLLVTRHDLNTLEEHGWLNSHVIEAYLETLRERHKEKKIISTGTHVFHNLDLGKCTEAHQSFRGEQVWDLDLILAPLHMPDPGHWALIVAHPRRQRIESYDSLGWSHNKELYQMYHALSREARMAGFTLQRKSWRLLNTRPYHPRQSNGDDCGVFVLYFAQCLVADRAIGENPLEIATLRGHIREALLDRLEEEAPVSPLSESEGFVVNVEWGPGEAERLLDEELNELATLAGQQMLPTPDDEEWEMVCAQLEEWIQEPPPSDLRGQELEEAGPTSPCLSLTTSLSFGDEEEKPEPPAPGPPAEDTMETTPFLGDPDPHPSSGEPEATPKQTTRRKRGSRGKGAKKRQTRKIIFPGGVKIRIPTRFLYPTNGY